MRAGTVFTPMVLAMSFVPLASAAAQEAQPRVLQISGDIVADVVTVRGGGDDGTRYLHRLDLVADLNLDPVLPWNGLTARVAVLNLAGGHPNELAGTLQGVDNIELGDGVTEIYEAWVEQAALGGRVSLRLGLADPNTEFYQNDSAGLLIGPSFGMGPELAAPGPAGLPTTGLVARLYAAIGKSGYVRAAAVGTQPVAISNHGIANWGIDQGAVLVVEAGWVGRGKLAAGIWRQTRRQPGYVDAPDGAGPINRVSQGGYVLADYPVLAAGAGRPSVAMFARIGLSDGATTPYHGGWQAGLLIAGPRVERSGRLSLGISQAMLSTAYCRHTGQVSGSETTLEATFAQPLLKSVTLQPDLQYILRPSGNPVIPNAFVATLRVTFSFAPK